MDVRRKLILFIGLLVIGALAAIIASERAAQSKSPRLIDEASIVGAPVSPPFGHGIRVSTTAHTPPTAVHPVGTAPPLTAATPEPTPAPMPSARLTTDPQGDLKSSQDRLNAIETLTQTADQLFYLPSLADGFGQWSVNPQDMDQLDYQTPDGNITAWYSPDGVPRAQEAQLPDGQLVDRWFSADGRVEQVIHQYDPRNSYSVYYYSTGEVEATRVVRDGAEIFTKYDRSGRQLERTQTTP